MCEPCCDREQTGFEPSTLQHWVHRPSASLRWKDHEPGDESEFRETQHFSTKTDQGSCASLRADDDSCGVTCFRQNHSVLAARRNPDHNKLVYCTSPTFDMRAG